MFLNPEIWFMYAVIGYLVINGLLQLFFVNWVLGRNKKLTILLVSHYRSIDKDRGGENDDGRE